MQYQHNASLLLTLIWQQIDGARPLTLCRKTPIEKILYGVDKQINLTALTCHM